MNKVAKILEMEPMQVYEVASFYTMFNRTRPGKYHIQFCGTTPCMIRGARECMDAIKEHCNIGMDETSADGLFTLSTGHGLSVLGLKPVLGRSVFDLYQDFPNILADVRRAFYALCTHIDHQLRVVIGTCDIIHTPGKSGEKAQTRRIDHCSCILKRLHQFGFAFCIALLGLHRNTENF